MDGRVPGQAPEMETVKIVVEDRKKHGIMKLDVRVCKLFETVFLYGFFLEKPAATLLPTSFRAIG